MMMNAQKFYRRRNGYRVGLSLLSPASYAAQEPHQVIEQTVQILLDEFVENRDEFAADKSALFALVDEVAVPIFDFPRIAKLVLAGHYKHASEAQRESFRDEFKKLLIGTYATALFQYTGDEKMIFTGSEIRERKGRKFATVHSQVEIGGNSPVAVDYKMLLGRDDVWRIYNLTIGGINMVTNYRATYAAAVDDLGLDGVLKSMREANAKLITKQS